MKVSTFSRVNILALLLISLFALAHFTYAQGMDRVERGRMKAILGVVKSDVKKNYYDPAYHGIDLDARFKAADQKLDTAATPSQAEAIIAQVLIDFNDSHLYFSPPPSTVAVEYGWRMEAIGDKVMVTQVKPGSDAAAKGLKPGDRIMSISGFRPSRGELWKVLYYYNVISKQSRMTLSVLSPGESAPHDLEIKSEIKKLPRSISRTTFFKLFDDFYDEENDKHRIWNLGNITVWKMPSFELDPGDVDSLMDRAKATGSLIIDLRGNGGGYVESMEHLVGNFFDKDLKISDLKGRKPMDPSIAKTRKGSVFSGKLVVLVDSQSASAAEIFARVIQMEGRGKILGDVSAGAVMQARRYSEDVGSDSMVLFDLSITNADVIMTDGKSLEHVGVIPDEVILPTGEDLAAGRDPVMARAVEMLGGKISPEDAGKFQKYYWKTD